MKYIPENCSICSHKLVSMDSHYNLPRCYTFLYVCPKHPGTLCVDLPDREINNLFELCSQCDMPSMMMIGPELNPIAQFCETHAAKFMRSNQKRRGNILKRLAS